MSTDALSWAFRLTLPPTDKLVLVALADRCGDAFTCFGSIKDTQARTGLSARAIQTAIGRLIARELVEVKQRWADNGRQRSNGYKLNVVEKWSAAHAPSPADNDRGEGAYDDTPVPAAGASPFLNRHLEPSQEEPSHEPPDAAGAAESDLFQGSGQAVLPTPTKPSTGKLTIVRAKEVYAPQFKAWYARYPRKEKPKDALTAYAQAIVSDGATPEGMLRALERQRDGLLEREVQYRPLPASWLRTGSWANGPVERSKGANDGGVVGGL